MSEKKENGDSNENSSKPELFLTDGMQLTISGLSITIGADGKCEAAPATFSTCLDMCPYWLEIAYAHLLRTEQAYNDLLSARETKNNEGIGDALQAEFIAGMQTMMASAIAIDAYYACIKERVEIPKELIGRWKENRIARYKQIAEVLRIAFPMKDESFKQVRGALKEIFRFRDMAVHPPSKPVPALLRPKLNLIIDWRYVAFSYDNAKAAVRLSLSIIALTARRPHKGKFDALKPYCETLMSKVELSINQWNDRYGKLLEDNNCKK